MTYLVKLGDLDSAFELLVRNNVFNDKDQMLNIMNSLGIAFYAGSSEHNFETRIKYLIRALVLLAWTQCYENDDSILSHIKLVLLSISAMINNQTVALNAEFDPEIIARELIISNYWTHVSGCSFKNSQANSFNYQSVLEKSRSRLLSEDN